MFKFKFCLWTALLLVLPTVQAAPLKILVSQSVEHAALNRTVDGIREGLKRAGVEDGKNISFRVESAQGNPVLAAQIARKFSSQQPAVVVGVGTLAAQSLALYARDKQVKLIFSSVTDPLASGLVKAVNEQPSFIAGVSNYMTLKPQLELFLHIQPTLKRLGILYNAGELNAVAIVKELQALCAEKGIVLVTQTVVRVPDIAQAAAKLATQVDALFVSNDNTVLSGFQSVVLAAQQAKIPVYVSDTDIVTAGALAALGPNQFDLGLQTSQMILRVLKGETMSPVAVEFPTKSEIYINLDVAKSLNIPLSDALLAAADQIIQKEPSMNNKKSATPQTSLITFSELRMSLELGLIFGVVALGIYLTFRVIDFPDLTCDGSFVLGAATCLMLIQNGVSPELSLIAAFITGSLAGMLTGCLSCFFGIAPLLSGILVAFMCYSVNLRVMGGVPNLVIPNQHTLFSLYPPLLVLGAISTTLWLGISYLLKTDFGLSLRSVGQNSLLARYGGVHLTFMTMMGLMLSNGLIAFGGGLFSQHDRFVDISQGMGTIVVGLAAVILGERLLPFRSPWSLIGACFAGSCLYRLFIAIALHSDVLGIESKDLNLIVGLMIVAVLLLSRHPTTRVPPSPLTTGESC